MCKKTQILYIHGGNTFTHDNDYHDFLSSRPIGLEKRLKWSGKYLQESLKNSAEIIYPQMPCKDRAEYADWKTHFERYIDLLDNDIILIGNSLGGIFLAKYLSENVLSKNLMALYLVCPPYDDTISHEELSGGFELPDDLSSITHQCRNIVGYFSADDPCVPISHADLYEKALPDSQIVRFESKGGHFQIPEFPELVEDIRNIL